jgi:hypothetical protein
MPSSKSVKRNLTRIPRPSNKALGAAAASVAVAGVVTGTCLSTTSAHGAPDALAGASHSTVLSSAAAKSLLGSVSAPGRPASDHAQRVVADKSQAPRHQAPAASAAEPKATAAATSKPQAAAPEVGAKVVARTSAPKKAAPHGHGNSGPFGHHSPFGRQSPTTAIIGGLHHNVALEHRAGEHRAGEHRAGEHRSGARRGGWHRVAAGPARPFQIYDSVTPSSIPSGKMVATYADGPYAVSPSQVQGHQVMWIDTNGSDPRANALDVEPGDATPQGAASWAEQRLSAYPHSSAIIYTMQSEWPATQAAVAALPHWMQHQVRWWIADPTGSPHVLPGANATQWYWGSGYDITTAKPGFWPNGR